MFLFHSLCFDNNCVKVLERLDLSGNRLDDVPTESLKVFEGLNALVLDDNPLTSLPSRRLTGFSVRLISVSWMSRLRFVDAEAIFDVRRLTTVALHDNPTLERGTWNESSTESPLSGSRTTWRPPRSADVRGRLGQRQPPLARFVVNLSSISSQNVVDLLYIRTAVERAETVHCFDVASRRCRSPARNSSYVDLLWTTNQRSTGSTSVG